ncbi:glycosyltransferase [Planctobacterium marinum]|uniref:GDP-Man:Man(1)GlcNAc(2)-PP-Dol alpha-1,3-mannosyltransferase n=1 Tax=Planctobacterium marinum TaxID=1631968 RepID=A0AA48I823_9ALTE|nr:mannosyltransferase [Planctobacterium marinum]
MHRDSFAVSTAVMYDFLQVKGGAEAVTLDLCKHFSNMDLITGWVNKTCFESLPIEPSRVTELTTSTAIPGWQTIKCAQTFLKSCPDLSRYESVIYSGSNAPLAILNTKAKKNIYYCHTPPRFVYDLRDYYLESIPVWQRPALKMLIDWFRPKYEQSLERMDVILCNSKNVQQRLHKFLNVEAEVVYPPVNVARFKHLSDGDYFLSTARLEPYKRVETIVRAFMAIPDKKLVVTSGGSQEGFLRNLAKDYSNISFTGWVTEQELARLVGDCLATIYIPKDEDFGMSPVESMGAGKPVIGVNEGGIRETVIDGMTGWLLDKEVNPNALVRLVSNICSDGVRNMKNHCLESSESFAVEKFITAIKHQLD